MVCWCLAVQINLLMPSITWLFESSSFSLGFLLRKITGNGNRKDKNRCLVEHCYRTKQVLGNSIEMLRTLRIKPFCLNKKQIWKLLQSEFSFAVTHLFFMSKGRDTRLHFPPFLFFSLVTTVMAMLGGGVSSPPEGRRLTCSERKLLFSVFFSPTSLFSPSFFFSGPCHVQ